MTSPTASSPPKRLRMIERLLAVTTGTIFKGSAAYTGALMVTAAGSAVFWAIATHVASKPDVGRAVALTTILNMLIFLTALPLLPVIARYGAGGDRGDRVVLNRTVLVATAVTGSGSLIVALAAIATGATQVDTLASPLAVLVFVAVSVGVAWSLIIEIRLLAEKRYFWMIGRAIVVNGASIALLIAGGAGFSPLMLFVASAGMVAVGGPTTWFLSQRRQPNWLALRPVPSNSKDVLRFATVVAPSTVAGQLAVSALPVLVSLTVEPASNAQFYVAWNAGAVAYLVVLSVGNALLVEGGREAALAPQVRQSFKLALGLACAIILGFFLISLFVPLVYGSGYEDSAKMLRWLCLSCLPLAAYSVSLTTARILHLRRRMIGLPLLLAVGVLGAAVPLTAAFSVGGATAAWLIGTVITGLVSVSLLRPFLRDTAANRAKQADLERNVVGFDDLV